MKYKSRDPIINVGYQGYQGVTVQGAAGITYPPFPVAMHRAFAEQIGKLLEEAIAQLDCKVK